VPEHRGERVPQEGPEEHGEQADGRFIEEVLQNVGRLQQSSGETAHLSTIRLTTTIDPSLIDALEQSVILFIGAKVLVEVRAEDLGALRPKERERAGEPVDGWIPLE
jgi:hypothetical protein